MIKCVNTLKIIVSFALCVVLTTLNAGRPAWTFTPLTSTTVTIYSGDITTIQYDVTNQSHKIHQLVMTPIPGITASGTCSLPFAYQQTCLLTLTVDSQYMTNPIIGGPVLCQQGNPLQCYQPSPDNNLAITVVNRPPPPPAGSTSLTISTTQLALSITGLTEHGVVDSPLSGKPRVITVTNTGSYSAQDLTISYPIWPTGTTATSTCGNTLASGDVCTITIMPGDTATSDGTNPCTKGTAPIPDMITIHANNATSISSTVVILGYGCLYQGGYVFALDDSLANTISVGGKVAALEDQADSIHWDSTPGCTNSISNNCIVTMANSITDGANLPTGNTSGNTYAILTAFNAAGYDPTQFSAAGLCTSLNNGVDNWYLPAICELGYANQGFDDGCGTQQTPLIQNIQSNLVDNMVITLPNPTYYWSSTQFPSGQQNDAYAYTFNLTRIGSASSSKGLGQAGVRCVHLLRS